MKINFYDPETKCLKLKKEENTLFYEQSTEKIAIFCGENENHTIFDLSKITFYQNNQKIILEDPDTENMFLSIRIFINNEMILSNESIISYYFNFLINSSIYLKKNIDKFIKKIKNIEPIISVFDLKLDENFCNNIQETNYIYSEKYYKNILILSKLLYIRDMMYYKKEIKKEIIELKLKVI